MQGLVGLAKIDCNIDDTTFMANRSKASRDEQHCNFLDLQTQSRRSTVENDWTASSKIVMSILVE